MSTAPGKCRSLVAVVPTSRKTCSDELHAKKRILTRKIKRKRLRGGNYAHACDTLAFRGRQHYMLHALLMHCCLHEIAQRLRRARPAGMQV